MARILVADDDAQIRTLLRIYLESAGHEVEEAENGAQAIRSYSVEPHDVALIDLLMPDVDGIEALRRMREWDPEARIIMMTGAAAIHDASLKVALRLGARRVLRKPMRLEEVGRVLDEALKH